MPLEITNHRTILDAIGKTDIISELVDTQYGDFTYELDLEVICYGRNYNGKRVGPYVRLFEFKAGEEIIREGHWGNNSFYIAVDGALDVYVTDNAGDQRKIDQLAPGASFGITSVLAGVPRSATVSVPPGSTARVLEVTRPALRLLRKLPAFGSVLDHTYKKHGLLRTLAEIEQMAGSSLDAQLLSKLGAAASFKVYGKQHVLFREGDLIDRIVFIKDGWVRRVHSLTFDHQVMTTGAVPTGLDERLVVDFLGAGHCLGLDSILEEARWGYSATVLQRTEVMEIPIERILSDARLQDALRRSFSSPSDDNVNINRAPPEDHNLVLTATEKEIETGIIDSANLLVMDMDRCVRCGNCSLACHKVHGQSRLLRRGIHIERPKKISSSSVQHVLLPSVCIHCHHPECLTGCPTGAIARFSGSQVDIDPKTCIGCGDCAAQCPYNAISMIPRKSPAPPSLTWNAWLKKLLTLSDPTPPPQPVTETEDLIAVTCNLCNNTGLNPKGAKRHAYSCQENCPTGALVRINPLEYFTEASSRINLIYRDRTHAIGRNIHHRDLIARLGHIIGIATTVGWFLLALSALSKYSLDGKIGETQMTMRWVTGLIGLTATAVAMTYRVRKQIYRRRAVPLRYWMLAHVYAGVISAVSFLLHGRVSTGGLLTSLLMISFDLVILSGLFGIACYIIVPRIMTSIEGEPLLIEDLRARRGELRETLANIGTQSTPTIREIIRRKVRPRYLSLSYLVRQYVRREDLNTLHSIAREDFKTELEPYRKPAEELSRTFLFGTDAPSQYIPEGRLLLDAIESTVTLRRVDSLIYLHQLLKLWLAPHILATILMLVLMLLHIIQVVFFKVH